MQQNSDSHQEKGGQRLFYKTSGSRGACAQHSAVSSSGSADSRLAAQKPAWKEVQPWLQLSPWLFSHTERLDLSLHFYFIFNVFQNYINEWYWQTNKG